jgi:DNA (cytosine-5)-methyltransferase 1
MYKPTAKGYFSGAGGLEIGMMQAGVNVTQSLDLDPDAIECMQNNPHYFGHRILHKDIKDITVKEQEKTDMILGTYPCTKYSTIADIHGTRTGDDLFLHFFRHIAIEQPEMYVVENVPGMKKFQVVMEAMTELPNYFINIFCPVNASVWLPQERKRLILIGSRKPFYIADPKEATRKPTIKSILESNPDVHMPQCVLNRINGKYRDKPIVVDPEDPNAKAPTCVAHYAKDQGTRLVKDKNSEHGVRPFTVREYARLQGFPDDFKFENKLCSYKLIGNAVAVDMGRWIGDEAVKYFNTRTENKKSIAWHSKNSH